MIEDIRRMRGDIIDFIFEWQKQYLTSERNRLMFCLLYELSLSQSDKNTRKDDM